MKIGTALQFDFLPVTVRTYGQKQNSEAHSGCRLEAYSEDQKVRQAKKAQSNVGGICMSKNTSNDKKRKRRTGYNTVYKKKQRQNPAFKAKKNLNQQTSKQMARKKPGVLAKEHAEKQSAREDPTFKAKEIAYQPSSKQKARKDLLYRNVKELNSSKVGKKNEN